MSASGSRKRRSSDSPPSDGKGISFERHFKPKSHVDIRTAMVSEKPNRQYVDQYNSDKRQVISFERNFKSSCGEGTLYEVQINSLRQCEPRDVNFANLQRHLSDIEIESCNNWNFSTALDLTEELGSSLLYFVDTSNELVFLKKLKRHRLLPYPYDEINITDHVELDNRIKFLENELNHRSYRMNQLFHRLQKVVTPSIIDDIRYVHCVSYQKSWCKRAHYWFSEFKEIQRDQYFSRTVESLPSKYQKSYGKIKDEFDVTNNVHIKSDDVVATSKTSFDRKTVKIKKSKIKKAKSSKIRSKDAKLRAGRPTTKSGKINQTMSSYANVWKTLQNLTNLVQNLEPGADNGNESDQSNSFEIIEPNVSVISISEDDDWSDDAHPSGGCTTKN